jgi:hypothetical protein
VGIVLVEPRLAKHDFQTFHGKNIERVMKGESINGDTCIVQDVCAWEGVSFGDLDRDGMRKR